MNGFNRRYATEVRFRDLSPALKGRAKINHRSATKIISVAR
jgi:hypothetical protein